MKLPQRDAPRFVRKKLKRGLGIAPLLGLAACGPRTDVDETSDAISDAMEDMLPPFGPDLSGGNAFLEQPDLGNTLTPPSNQDATDPVKTEPEVPVVSFIIEMSGIETLDPGLTFSYAPTSPLPLAEINQNYAESYLSEHKNIAKVSTWSGNEAIDALLLANSVFADKTDYFWTGIGGNKIISFSFVDTAALLLDEAAYNYQYTGDIQPINVVYDNPIGVFTENQKDAIRQGFAEYEKFLDIKFVEVLEESNTVGTLRVGLSLTTFSDVAAFAITPDRYWSSAGDIWLFKDAARDAFTPSESWYYFAFLHELGHALGLKHPHEALVANEITLEARLDQANYTIMSYNEPNWGWYDTPGRAADIWTISNGPQVLDIHALQFLYGANNEYNSANTIYTFDPTKPVSLAIWDSDGTDLLDFSQMEVGITLSLLPGSYSTAPIRNWHPVDNIGIAHGSIIENAYGSNANDVIYGNDANNLISGGSGDDVIYGANGDDVFDAEATMRGGSDTFYGGPGDDTYYLDAKDTAVELGDEGIDTIILLTSTNFLMPDNIERISIAHTENTVILGNALDNIICGGAGSDVLTGGSGADIFLVHEKMGDDIITDFNPTEGDHIEYMREELDFTYAQTQFGFTLDFDEHGFLTVYEIGTIV